MGVQPYVCAGDEEPVKHRRRVPAPHPHRLLGEVGDEELDFAVPAAEHSHEMKALARATGPGLGEHRVLKKDVLDAVRQRIEPETGLIKQLSGVGIGPGERRQLPISAVHLTPVIVCRPWCVDAERHAHVTRTGGCIFKGCAESAGPFLEIESR